MINTNPQKIEEILNRGVEDVVVKEELKKKLLSGKRIRLYFGIDPTSSILHLGHTVCLWKLRDFQDLGHEVILLIGDFTARIGDPSGKDTMRVPLSKEKVKENLRTYKRQAEKILDFNKVKIKYNSSWLSKLKFEDILKLASNFTVQQMIQRDMFQRRIEENLPINLREFMYPLMQGYDSVVMDVDLEIAGSDQTFNALIGRELQKIYHNKDKYVLTTKLLLGTDGRKMSKTYQNFIAIEDDPRDMFGKVMSISDELIDDYFELATRLREEEIREIKELPNPRDQKARLAKEIVRLYWGEQDANAAESEFNKVFRDKQLPEVIPEFAIDKKEYFILDLLCDTRLASSKNEAKRLVEGGGVEMQIGDKKEKITDWKREIILESGAIIKVGSRKFIKIHLVK